MREDEKKFCKRLYSAIWEMPISAPFRFPVDPVLDKAENYFDLIKKPMDLTTLRLKLKNNNYNTIDEFVADMRLICDNARLYNGAQSFYGMMSDDIQTEINKLLKKRQKELTSPYKTAGELIQRMKTFLDLAPPEIDDVIAAANKNQNYPSTQTTTSLFNI